MNPLSGVIGEAWRMYRAHAVHLIVIAFVVYLAAAILDGIVSLAGGFVTMSPGGGTYNRKIDVQLRLGF